MQGPRLIDNLDGLAAGWLAGWLHAHHKEETTKERKKRDKPSQGWEGRRKLQSHARARRPPPPRPPRNELSVPRTAAASPSSPSRRPFDRLEMPSSARGPPPSFCSLDLLNVAIARLRSPRDTPSSPFLRPAPAYAAVLHTERLLAARRPNNGRGLREAMFSWRCLPERLSALLIANVAMLGRQGTSFSGSDAAGFLTYNVPKKLCVGPLSAVQSGEFFKDTLAGSLAI